MADRRYAGDAQHTVNENDAMGPTRTMEHSERQGRDGGILYPLLLVAAIAVIVFSIIGIAKMTGVVPNVENSDGAARQSSQSGPDHKGKPARLEAPKREPAPRSSDQRTLPSGGEGRELRAVRGGWQHRTA
jgi:hypothetical protein